MFFARASIFYIKKCNFKNNQKITKKSICRWCLAVFGFRPLRQTIPRAIFDGICDVLCTSSTLQKRAVFVPPGAGRGHMAPPPIAKAKAMPQGCGSICPASDALCIAGLTYTLSALRRRPRRNRCVFSCKMRPAFILTVNLNVTDDSLAPLALFFNEKYALYRPARFLVFSQVNCVLRSLCLYIQMARDQPLPDSVSFFN